MIFGHYRAAKALKRENKNKEIIGIFHNKYEVIERLPDDENGKLPVIVKRHMSGEGYKVFEPKRGHLSEVEFKSIQRIAGDVFFAKTNGKADQEVVYIINENGQTALSEHDYNYVVGKENATKEMTQNSPYAKYSVDGELQKQPGTES